MKSIKFEFHQEVFDRAERIARGMGVSVDAVMSSALEAILAHLNSVEVAGVVICGHEAILAHPSKLSRRGGSSRTSRASSTSHRKGVR